MYLLLNEDNLILRCKKKTMSAAPHMFSTDKDFPSPCLAWRIAQTELF